MLGIKCSKLPQLKALLDSASKQQGKCKRMVLGPSAEDLKKWLASFEQFKVLIPKFDGMTGTQMLEMYDDEPLKQLGLYSEVDHKYLVLFLKQPCNRSDFVFDYAAPSNRTSPGACQDCRRCSNLPLCFECILVYGVMQAAHQSALQPPPLSWKMFFQGMTGLLALHLSTQNVQCVEKVHVYASWKCGAVCPPIH